MENRVNISKAEPEGYKALLALEKYIQSSVLTPTHKELIKMRVAQINGCAFCIDSHTKAALANGESMQRIFLLSAWKETDFFTDEEKAILDLTEAITKVNGNIPDKVYNQAAEYFDENYLANIILSIVNINGLTRVGITTNLAKLIEPAAVH